MVEHIRDSRIWRVFVNVLLDGGRTFLLVDLMKFGFRLVDLGPPLDRALLVAIVTLLVALVHRLKDRL